MTYDQAELLCNEVHAMTRMVNSMTQQIHDLVRILSHPMYTVSPDHNHWSPQARMEFRDVFSEPLPRPAEGQEIRREGWDR